jgi:hypothetical protein
MIMIVKQCVRIEWQGKQKYSEPLLTPLWWVSIGSAQNTFRGIHRYWMWFKAYIHTPLNNWAGVTPSELLLKSFIDLLYKLWMAWWRLWNNKWNEWMAMETEVLAGNLLQCRSVHHRSHMTGPGLEHGHRGGKPVITAWVTARAYLHCTPPRISVTFGAHLRRRGMSRRNKLQTQTTQATERSKEGHSDRKTVPQRLLQSPMKRNLNGLQFRCLFSDLFP